MNAIDSNNLYQSPWFQRILFFYVPDDTLLQYHQAILSVSDRKASGRLQSLLLKRVSPIFGNSSKQNKRNKPPKYNKKNLRKAIAISVYFSNLQTSKEGDSPIFNLKKYCFIRSILKILRGNAQVNRSLNYCLSTTMSKILTEGDEEDEGEGEGENEEGEKPKRKGKARQKKKKKVKPHIGEPTDYLRIERHSGVQGDNHRFILYSLPSKPKRDRYTGVRMLCSLTFQLE